MNVPLLKVPFRIGATSFVYPDRWVSNVARLASRVEDIELLFFETEELPDAAEIDALAAWKRQAGLTYTLHLPLRVNLACEDEPQRHRSVAMVRHVIDHARPLAPDAYVLHVELDDRENDPLPRDVAAWRRRAARSLEEILRTDVVAEALCVETLDYEFALIEPVVEKLGLSVAVDVGHLARDRRPVDELLLRNLHRTRVIQWHGVDMEGHDHHSLRFFPLEHARRLLRTLSDASYRGVLTLEVFQEGDFEESLALVCDLIVETAA
jgi:sugar phosphate isomerase/epimerase